MKKVLSYLLVFVAGSAFTQIGGTKTFSFLDLPVPARSNALGGASIAIWDKDVNLGYANPALLNPNNSKQLSFNVVKFVSDLSYGNFLYAHQLKKYGTLGVGLQFFNYGKFDGRDEYDVGTGVFNAADYSLNMSFAKTLTKDSSLSLGVALKTIYSHYDIYNSFGNVVDVGLTYHNKKQFTASIVAKNYGRQWKPYSENGPKENLPKNVQIAFSKKIPKAPFRVIFQYDQLLKWDLTYVNPQDQSSDIDPFTNKPIVKTDKQKRNDKMKAGLDKFGRHLTIGTEIILGKNFMIRVAYNFRKGKEMALPDVKKANGLSLGFGLKVYKFHLDYAYSKYALTGNSHTFGITTNLNYFKKTN
ncbi:MAG: type IX secretion system protein PorQ [Bacteroidetes bacterium]|nr:type IX secretion system protein PorQ [Bacteroidota bacterium]